jgi:DNA replication protein DnaC
MVSLREAALPYLTRLTSRRAPGASDAASDAPALDDTSSSASAIAPVGSQELASRKRQARRTELSGPAVCPICHGAGYVRLDVPVGDPTFGKAVLCECKEREIAERERTRLIHHSSLGPFSNKTFETFTPRIPGVREAYEVALDYAQDPTGWLIFQGTYGCGKTHLAAAIALHRERLAIAENSTGIPVFFAIVPDLLDHLRAAFAPTSEMTYDELFDRVRQAELLVLDDLGSENGTAWATEKLFQIINYRYNSRMPTVITTNQRLLSHMDERIRSRLTDRGLVRWVAIEARDYRERHAGQPGRQPRGGGGGPHGHGFQKS